MYEVLRGCQVEMIIFDEAQWATAQALSEIKGISDMLDIVVVLVGTDRLNTMLQRDKQVGTSINSNLLRKCSYY